MDEARVVADARLDEALRRLGYADPRRAYRERLRELKAANPALFDEATRRYEESIVRAIGGGADALEAWIDYGRFLGELSGVGRVVAVDASGLASARAAAAETRDLILFVPDDTRANVLPLACPVAPSPAQRATYDLLVLGRAAL